MAVGLLAVERVVFEAVAVLNQAAPVEPSVVERVAVEPPAVEVLAVGGWRCSTRPRPSSR